MVTAGARRKKSKKTHSDAELLQALTEWEAFVVRVGGKLLSPDDEYEIEQFLQRYVHLQLGMVTTLDDSRPGDSRVYIFETPCEVDAQKRRTLFATDLWRYDVARYRVTIKKRLAAAGATAENKPTHGNETDRLIIQHLQKHKAYSFDQRRTSREISAEFGSSDVVRQRYRHLKKAGLIETHAVCNGGAWLTTDGRKKKFSV